MKKKTYLFFLMAVLTISTVGCGKKSPSNETQVVETQNEAESQKTDTQGTNDTEQGNPKDDTEGDDTQNINDSSEAINLTAEHNGDHFIQVGDKVYYRALQPGEKTQITLGGNYLLGYDQALTDIRFLDVKTKETGSIYSGHSAGKIFYSNGRLYLSRTVMEGEEQSHDIISIKLDGSDEVVLPNSERSYPTGYEPKTDSIIMDSYKIKDDRGITYPCLEIWQDGNLIADVKEEGESVEFVAAGEGQVIYSYMVTGEELYDFEKQYLMAYDIVTGQKTLLGELPKPEYSSYYNELDHVVFHGDTVYIMAGKREGSGHFLNEVLELTVKLNQENSLKMQDLPGDLFYDTDILPYFEFVGDNVTWVSRDPNGVYTQNGDLYVGANAEDGGLIKGFLKRVDYNEDVVDDFEYGVNLGNYAYLIWNTIEREPQEDVGWRYAYSRNATYYQRVDLMTGEVETLAESICETGYLEN